MRRQGQQELEQSGLPTGLDLSCAAFSEVACIPVSGTTPSGPRGMQARETLRTLTFVVRIQATVAASLMSLVLADNAAPDHGS